VWLHGDDPLATRRSAMRARHIGFLKRFIDENKPTRRQHRLLSTPILTPLLHV
jgi:hypothetical protein